MNARYSYPWCSYACNSPWLRWLWCWHTRSIRATAVDRIRGTWCKIARRVFAWRGVKRERLERFSSLVKCMRSAYQVHIIRTVHTRIVVRTVVWTHASIFPLKLLDARAAIVAHPGQAAMSYGTSVETIKKLGAYRRCTKFCWKMSEGFSNVGAVHFSFNHLT